MGDTDAVVKSAIPIDAAGQPDFRTASDFLRSIFNGQERGVLAIFCKPDNVSYFSHLDRAGWHSDAAFNAMQLRDHFNVYFAVGLQGGRPDKGRGKEVGVISLPGFWADIDVLGPNHVALAIAAMRGSGPPFVKTSGELGQRGGRVLYSVEKLEAWLAARPRGGDRQAPA